MYHKHTNMVLLHTLVTQHMLSKKPDDASDEVDAKPPPIWLQIVAILLTLYTVYLSFKRNDGFSFGPFLASLFFPLFYMIYAYAVPFPPVAIPVGAAVGA
jgi:antibiotic biosynthesis monooxygenase (ABM) superfamily enzyme